jgi:hypothetical protein
MEKKMIIIWVIALLMLVIGWFRLLVMAFKTSILWGIVVLIPGGVLIFVLINYSQEVKKPALMTAIGYMILMWFAASSSASQDENINDELTSEECSSLGGKIIEKR